MNAMFSNLSISPYGMCVSIGLLLWLVYSLYSLKNIKKRRRASVSPSAVLALFAASVPFGLICARLFWCISNYQFYLLKPKDICRIWEGGLSLWGFILGFWLSVKLFSRRIGVSAALSLDVFSAGLMLFISVIRVAEAFTGQGVGRIITYEFLVTPLTSVYDSYMEPHFAVYRFEAIYAFILFALTLLRQKRLKRMKQRTRGDLWRFAVGGYAMAQIVFESMRDDDYMRFGFVRVSQALSILLLLIFAFYYLFRLRKARLLKAHAAWLIPLTLASAGLVIFQEFRVDAALNTEKEHFFMMIYAFFLFVPSLFSMNRLLKRKK